MGEVTLVVDVGDVLVTTRPNAHYARLAELAELAPDEVAARFETAMLPDAFERGQITIDTFTEEVRMALARPQLTNQDIRAAWNRVIGDPVAPLVTAVAEAALHCEVILASNTNPLHWQQVQRQLGQRQFVVNPVLSHVAGCRKPEQAFFAALAQRLNPRGAVIFIDDKQATVTAARDHGMDGWIHTDPDVTIDRLQRRLPA